MATYYVGPTSAGLADGSSWANRYGSLNAAEDTPVAASDVVIVGPGVYRETLTVDVSGGAGANVITYIADVTGQWTDGVGGIVRITGSDDDQIDTRDYGITATAKDYRTFRGFTIDTCNLAAVRLSNCDYVILEDCHIGTPGFQVYCIRVESTSTNCTIRRCVFQPSFYGSILFTHSATVDNTGHVVENCLVLGGYYQIVSLRIGGITVRNCTLRGGYIGVRVGTALAGGQTITVNNCIIEGCATGVSAVNVGEITEDYNSLWNNNTDRTNTSTGANSVAYASQMLQPTLHSGASQGSGYQFGWWVGELSEWSSLRQIEGSSEPSADLSGIPRPATGEKNSWGALQFEDRELEDVVFQAGSYGRVINDAGQVLVRRVPVTNVETTVTLYMRKSTNYEGSEPRMVIKQPGQADQTDDMTAAVDTWEQLSITWTPAATPGYVEVWAESRHAPTSVDSEVGALSYTTDGAQQTFTDAGQDFSAYDTDPTVTDAIASHYIIVTNDDGTQAKGWLGEIGGAGNTEITVYNQQRLNDNGTGAPAMWIGKYAAKTPSTYDVFETGRVYFDTMDVS